MPSFSEDGTNADLKFCRGDKLYCAIGWLQKIGNEPVPGVADEEPIDLVTKFSSTTALFTVWVIITELTTKARAKNYGSVLLYRSLNLFYQIWVIFEEFISWH